MIEALPAGSVAIALLEVDDPADEQEPEAYGGDRLDMRWLHRSGRSVPGDPDPVLEAVAGWTCPPESVTSTWPPRPAWCAGSPGP